ncbi:porin [Litorilituus sediminis]|uniref:Porin n=1 Tax=Litorilituus sediminis TaxID=718192 RepID=A0A4P6P9I5_9GAMM|nr:porin [Litorilituus sediminis]QBG36205.1 porin [Litorilituus sediminis]
MKLTNLAKTSLASLCLISTCSLAEVNISGFSSINVGKVLSGTGVEHYGIEPTFLADYPNVSAYNEEWDFEPESLFGIQFDADLMDGLSATAQIVARGTEEWKPEFEWAYISYELNENWTLQAGKKRLPLFYYSDFYDVGYAYVWMRPSADNYTWQIFNYTGMNVLYSTDIGDWSLAANLYGGKEDDKDNKLLGDYFSGGVETREIWKDILGGVVNISKDWFEARFTAMQYTNERYVDGERKYWGEDDYRDGTFYGAAFNFDFENLFVLTELSHLAIDEYSFERTLKFDSRMITVGYRIQEFTPFVAYSEFEQEGEDGENHNTQSVGLRWDFHSSAAFKVQYDKVEDNSYWLAVAGDSESLTFGVDLIF